MPDTLNDFQTIVEEGRKVFQFLTSPQLQEKLLPLRITFIIFFVLFLIITAYLLWRSSWLGWWKLKWLIDFLTARSFVTKKITRKWQKIKKTAEGSEVQQKLSLLKARSLFDAALQRMGYPEESLAEKLKNLTTAQISNLEGLFLAENLCQDILRDPDYRLERGKTKEIIDVFEKALQELELL